MSLLSAAWKTYYRTANPYNAISVPAFEIRGTINHISSSEMQSSQSRDAHFPQLSTQNWLQEEAVFLCSDISAPQLSAWKVTG